MATPEAQLARIRAGEDASPVQEGVWMTPEQMWHSLLEMHPATRLDRLAALIANSQRAEACFMQNHDKRIAFLEEQIEREHCGACGNGTGLCQSCEAEAASDV
jgi:hypothetical protein